MIIQCVKCQTKFRLDDSRVTDAGVKVRCTKCKHVFSVKKEAPTPDFAAPAPFAAPFDIETPVQMSPPAEPEKSDPFEPSSFDVSTVPFETDGFAGGIPESSGAEDLEPPAKEENAFGDLDFPEPALSEPSTPTIDEYGDMPIEPPDTVASAAAEIGRQDDALAGDARPASGTGHTFYFDTPFDNGNIDFEYEPLPVEEKREKPKEEEPFREIFSRQPVEEQGAAGNEEPPQLFQDGNPAPVGALQTLPPLSITSRRKQSALFSAVISITAVLLVSGLAYLGYRTLSAPKESAVVLEAGKTTVQAVKAAFIENREAGELLVISGAARNEYQKPRAALQVKVTVFDASGQSVAVKTAYCGNMLTDEQLKSLPLDKIEATMANQFGDSLVNMEVAPGKTIPFVVVLAAIPKGAKDFGVEPAGSTVAAGKP